MIVYEVHVGDFNRNFVGLVAQLDHLVGLGVNVLELMPVSPTKEEVGMIDALTANSKSLSRMSAMRLSDCDSRSFSCCKVAKISIRTATPI
ncbi:hypothetical protein ASD03_31890 [Ensifer sp. Root127]|nr:hypothetical protein ASD03_31890 [Ensifer sp. Root127]